MKRHRNIRWTVVWTLLMTSSAAAVLGWSSVQSLPETLAVLHEIVQKAESSPAELERTGNPEPLITAEAMLICGESLPEGESQIGVPIAAIAEEASMATSDLKAINERHAWQLPLWEEVEPAPTADARPQPAGTVYGNSWDLPSWESHDLQLYSPPPARVGNSSAEPLTVSPSPIHAMSERFVLTSTSQAPPPPSKADSSASSGNTDPNKNRHIHEIRDWLRGVAYPVFGSGFYVGNELTLLTTERAGQTRVRFTDLQDGSIREAVSPGGFGAGYRLTLGMRGEASGFRVRYWTFGQENVRLFRDDLQGLWPELSAWTRREMTALDIELTQNYCLCGMQIEASFGGRYASYEGTDVVTGVGSLHKIMELNGLAQSYRSMSGYGPTFSIGGRRALPWTLWGCEAGCCSVLPSLQSVVQAGNFEAIDFSPGHCGWSWYWNLRGSVLWADTKVSALTDAQVLLDGGAGYQGLARSRDTAMLNRQGASGTILGEIQLGLEYQRPIACLPACLSFRAGLEFHRWDTGRSQARSESFGALNGSGIYGDLGGRVDASAMAQNQYQDLLGLSFMVGINY